MVHCPTPSELELFLEGRVSEEEERRIEAHQTTCHDCSKWIAEARADDALLPDLKRAREGTGESKPQAPPAGLEEGEPDMARYRILGRLGTGGMGVVYEAEQRSPKRRVALKVLRAGLFSTRALRRFEHEAEVLGRLVHPGIAQILEAGTYESHGEERPFFAMELVEGQPLGAWAADDQRTVRERLELFLEVSAAVEHAHQKGVVHRDLKPANILVTPEGRSKVLDFGVARTFDADVQVTTMRSQAGEIVGTLPYMSPEQLSGDPLEIDTRTDVYALGVLLYELLAGQLPYRTTGRSVPEMIRLMGMSDPEPLGTLRPDLPEDLGTIARKALEKDKNFRYASAAAVADDVRRHLNYEPIEARPPSAIYQLKKFTRRNRAVVAGLALTFGALMAGIVATSWQAARAKRAELEALESEQLARDAEAAARAEAESAVEVNAFLHSMLGFDPMDPLGARYRGDTTLLEIIDNAEQRLDENPLNDPRSEAKIRIAMGAIWARLEDQERTFKNRQRALDLRLDLHGPRHLKVAEARNTVAVSCVNLGRLDVAEEHLREALAIYEELGDPEQDRKVGTTLGNLGSVLLRRGDLDGAEELLLRAREIHERTLGPYNLHVSNAVSQLATIADERGETERALELQREAIEIARAAGLIEHPHAVSKLNALAAWLKREGRWREAEPLFRESIEIRERLFPAEHIDLAIARQNFAVYLKSTGRSEEAKPLIELAIPVLRQYPDRIDDLAYALMTLGECLFNEDPELSVVYLREALGKFQTARATRTTLATCRVSIARALRESGDTEAARTAYRQALASFPSSHGKQSYEMTARYHLGKLDMEAGEPVESYEPLFRSVVELEPMVRRQVDRHLDDVLLAARVLLAGIVRERGELEQAETLLTEGLAADPQAYPSTLHYARRELTTVLDDLGKHDEIENLLTKVLREETFSTETEQSYRIELLARLGRAKMALGQHDRAEGLFSEALDQAQQLHGDRSQEMAEVLAAFGVALQRAGRNESATNAFEDSIDIIGEDPPADVHQAEHLASYGHALIATQSYVEAEAVLLDCLGGIEGFASDDVPIAQEVLELLTVLYEAWDMPGSADEYRERLVASASGE